MVENVKAGGAQPLQGIRVLDLTRYVAGPQCAMLLGDFGADVVKVERPGRGEDLRHSEPKLDGENLFMMTLNRNKRSLAINLYSEEGRDLLRRLAAVSDVLIENFRPGTLEEMGCGWEALHEINPRLIVVRISGFGQTGPLAEFPAYDVIAQAMSGLMSVTGTPDSPPTMAGTILVDYTAALYAAFGVMLALRAREQTGEGQLVDCTLLDSATSLLMGWIPEYLLLGRKPERIGCRDRYTAPSNIFQSAEGRWVHIIASTDKHFRGLAGVMGRPELADDPRYAVVGERLKAIPFLEGAVSEWAATQNASDIVDALRKVGVPCALVADIADLVENPQLKFRQKIIEVEHPNGTKVPVQGTAVQLSATPARVSRGVPSVGQHTGDILGEWLGVDGGEVEALRDKKVVA
jgi:crotonobetainyl-CoA:carnitine CoA-transferase CaiB-like acyl-CoA transferase